MNHTLPILVLLAFVLVAVVFVALAKAKSTSSAGGSVWPFHLKKPLSAPEQVLFFRLVQALPDHIVLAQVQMSRFLGVNRGTDNPKQWLNRISQKSVDFVVCTKDASVVAVIELDDKSHARADRVAADEAKDKALAAAGVRLIRWNVKSIPDADAIKAAIAAPAALADAAHPLATSTSAV